MSSKLDKKILSLTETILGDATDDQKKAWIPFLESMITDDSSPAASPVKKRKGKKDDSPSPSPDSPAESPSSPDLPSSPDESPASPDSPSSPDESPEVKKSSKDKNKNKGKKEESPDSPDSPDAEDDSPSSPDAEDDSPAESPDSPDSPDAEDDSPEVKKSSKDKKVSKKAAEEDEDDSAVDYSAMSERALVKHLTEEKGIDAASVKPIKADKKKLIKLAKGYDELFTKYSALSLSKLEKIVSKNDIKVSFGRGRSNDEKKVRIIAQTLAANGIA